jgi:hypothetical protein
MLSLAGAGWGLTRDAGCFLLQFHHLSATFHLLPLFAAIAWKISQNCFKPAKPSVNY